MELKTDTKTYKFKDQMLMEDICTIGLPPMEYADKAPSSDEYKQLLTYIVKALNCLSIDKIDFMKAGIGDFMELVAKDGNMTKIMATLGSGKQPKQ